MTLTYMTLNKSWFRYTRFQLALSSYDRYLDKLNLFHDDEKTPISNFYLNPSWVPRLRVTNLLVGRNRPHVKFTKKTSIALSISYFNNFL